MTNTESIITGLRNLHAIAGGNATVFDAAIRKIQAAAWDRGQHAAFGFSVEHPHFTPSDMIGTPYDNPYREEH